MLTKPLSIIFQQLWQTREVPADWKSASMTPIYKKGRERDLRNCRPVNLTLVSGKLTEQVILNTITQHIQDKQMTRSSHHGFMKSRSSLTSLISSDKMRIRERLEALSVQTSVKPLTSFPTAFSWTNWLHMAWMSECFTGLKAGWIARPKDWWRAELNPTGG